MDVVGTCVRVSNFHGCFTHAEDKYSADPYFVAKLDDKLTFVYVSILVTRYSDAMLLLRPL